MADLKQWVADRVEADRRLYERFGKPLEATYRGKYVAIGPDGQTILGDTDLEVLGQAITAFGAGNFALRRVGGVSVSSRSPVLRDSLLQSQRSATNTFSGGPS